MMLQPGQHIVMRGAYLYDELVPCEVVIVRGPVFYGSGDDEDPPELADDREQASFYIWYGSPAAGGQFNAGGGVRFSLLEAMQAVENAPGIGSSVRWIDA